MRASYLRQIARPVAAHAPRLTPSRRWPLRAGEERPPAVAAVDEPLAVAEPVTSKSVRTPTAVIQPPAAAPAEAQPHTVDPAVAPAEAPAVTAHVQDSGPDIATAPPARGETRAPAIADSTAPISTAPLRLQRKNAPQRQAAASSTKAPLQIRVAPAEAEQQPIATPASPAVATTMPAMPETIVTPSRIALRERLAATTTPAPPAEPMPAPKARVDEAATPSAPLALQPLAIAPPPQRTPALPPRLRPAEPAGTTVRIGSIEVKVAPPPAPPPPSPAAPAARAPAAAPRQALSRGFASPFGLRQG